MTYYCTVKNELRRSIRITVQKSCIIFVPITNISILLIMPMTKRQQDTSAEKLCDDPPRFARNQVHLTSHTCTLILQEDTAESRDVAIQTHVFSNPSGTEVGHTRVR